MDPFIIYEILDHSSESSTHISLVPFLWGSHSLPQALFLRLSILDSE